MGDCYVNIWEGAHQLEINWNGEIVGTQSDLFRQIFQELCGNQDIFNVGCNNTLEEVKAVAGVNDLFVIEDHDFYENIHKYTTFVAGWDDNDSLYINLENIQEGMTPNKLLYRVLWMEQNVSNGCTDVDAGNYDPGADTDDGSCFYNICINDSECMTDCSGFLDFVNEQGDIVGGRQFCNYLDSIYDHPLSVGGGYIHECLEDCDYDVLSSLDYESLLCEECTELDLCDEIYSGSSLDECVIGGDIVDLSGGPGGIGCTDCCGLPHSYCAYGLDLEVQADFCEYHSCIWSNPECMINCNAEGAKWIAYVNSICENACDDSSNCAEVGCYDSIAINFNGDAVIDFGCGGTCEYNDDPNTVYGCMDGDAVNYNPDATFDDDSCYYQGLGDMNNDGSLNVIDIVAMANLVLVDGFTWYADVNQDSDLNVIDIVMLANWVLNTGCTNCISGYVKDANNNPIDNMAIILTYDIVIDVNRENMPCANIYLDLPIFSDVFGWIENTCGDTINILVDSYFQAGSYSISWCADDIYGNTVVDGSYKALLNIDNSLFTHDMFLNQSYFGNLTEIGNQNYHAMTDVNGYFNINLDCLSFGVSVSLIDEFGNYLGDTTVPYKTKLWMVKSGRSTFSTDWYNFSPYSGLNLEIVEPEDCMGSYCNLSLPNINNKKKIINPKIW